MSAATRRTSEPEEDAAARARVEGALGRLVVLGTQSDHVAGLLAFLSSTLRRPVAVADRLALPVACAPPGALDAATLAGALAAPAAPGAPWRVLPLHGRDEPAGFLVLRAEPPPAPEEHALIEVARALIADQLRRAAMTARMLDERRGALKRRVVGDVQLTPAELRAETARARMTLADDYRPAIVSWDRGEAADELLTEADALVHRHAPDHVAVRHDARTLVVLVAEEPGATEHETRARALVEEVVELVRRHLAGARVRGLLASAGVPLADVAARVEELRRLALYLERRQAPLEGDVQSESTFAFLRLLEAVDRRRAAAFVVSELGPLLSYDRAHGAHLTDVLEIALDMSNRTDAARAAYMHRNTFRRNLEQAKTLLGTDLADPDERLAVHVALKLTSLLGIRRSGRFTVAPPPDAVRGAPPGLTRHGGWSEPEPRPRSAGDPLRARPPRGG